MSYRHLVLAVLGISLFGTVQANQLGYTFDLSNGLFSQDCQLLEDITGQTPEVLPDVCVVPDAGVFGSITYDNEGAFDGDNGLGASLYSATVSLTSTLVIGGSEIGTVSADNGTVVVNDDPGGNDLLNVAINNADDNWSTFMIGDYQIVTGSAIWLNGDFLADETLPDMLPPPPGYELSFFNFGVVDTVNSPGIIQGFGAIGLEVMPVPTFDDVPTDHWAFSFIETLAASGITAGCGNDNYCPLSPVTRAQMAVFLERGIHGSDFSPPAATGNVFLDVSVGSFAVSFIEQFFLDGITAGCGNNNYCPDAEVTRDQMAVFLLRAEHGADYSPPAATGIFNDVPLNHWAVHWIEQLAAEGITAGCGNGNYCPSSVVTRDQMAVFLVRTFGL